MKINFSDFFLLKSEDAYGGTENKKEDGPAKKPPARKPVLI